MPYLPDLPSPRVPEMATEDAVVLLPIGAIEQHGAHLPLATDTLMAQALANAVDDGEEPVVWRLPTLAYGKSNEHIAFTGTLTLATETLLCTLDDISASVLRAGFSRLALLNAHGGNFALLSVAARDIRVRYGLRVATLNPLAGAFAEAKSPDIDPDEVRYGIHAGRLETSVMLYLHPELVDLESASGQVRKLSGGDSYLGFAGPQAVAWLASDLADDGVLGNPSGANAEEGQSYFEDAVRLTKKALSEFSSIEFTTNVGRRDGIPE